MSSTVVRHRIMFQVAQFLSLMAPLCMYIFVSRDHFALAWSLHVTSQVTCVFPGLRWPCISGCALLLDRVWPAFRSYGSWEVSLVSSAFNLVKSAKNHIGLLYAPSLLIEILFLDLELYNLTLLLFYILLFLNLEQVYSNVSFLFVSVFLGVGVLAVDELII
jgi:hypothetical protein